MDKAASLRAGLARILSRPATPPSMLSIPKLNPYAPPSLPSPGLDTRLLTRFGRPMKFKYPDGALRSGVFKDTLGKEIGFLGRFTDPRDRFGQRELTLRKLRRLTGF